MKTFPDAHLCDGENMKDKKVGYVYGYLLAISFLSTGMSALITFPRSIGSVLWLFAFFVERAYWLSECSLWQID